jgi:N-formylmaleamate deformylase
MKAIASFRPIEQLVPEHWRTAHFGTSDGQLITYYDTLGRGPAVVLLHGFQSAGLAWLRTAKALEDEYRIVMPDLRGHGHSASSLAGFSLERLTADVAELIEVLRLDRPFVVGHSMGGEIAGRLAAQHHERLRGVVLVDPPMRTFSAPPASDDEMPPWMRQWLDNLRAIREQPHPERLRTALKLLPPGTADWGEDDLVGYADACARLNLDIVQLASTMLYDIATPERASKIAVPLLLLTGDPHRGSVATHSGITALTDRADRTHVVIEHAGHFIPVDQWERFVAVVRRFLEQTG